MPRRKSEEDEVSENGTAAAAAASPPASRLRSARRSSKRKRRTQADDDDGGDSSSVQTTTDHDSVVEDDGLAAAPPSKKHRATARRGNSTPRRKSNSRTKRSNNDDDDDDSSMTDASSAIEEDDSKPKAQNGHNNNNRLQTVQKTQSETQQDGDSNEHLASQDAASAAAAPTNGTSVAAASASTARLQPISKLRMPSKHTPGKLQTTAPAPGRRTAAALFQDPERLMDNVVRPPPSHSTTNRRRQQQQQQQHSDDTDSFSPQGIANDELTAMLAVGSQQQQVQQENDQQSSQPPPPYYVGPTSWYQSVTDAMAMLVYSTIDFVKSLFVPPPVEQFADGQDESDVVIAEHESHVPLMTRPHAWFVLLLLLQLTCWNSIVSTLHDTSDRSFAFYKSLAGVQDQDISSELSPPIAVIPNDTFEDETVVVQEEEMVRVQLEIQSLLESLSLLDNSDDNESNGLAIVEKELLLIHGRLRERQQALNDWQDGLVDVESALNNFVAADDKVDDDDNDDDELVPRLFSRANEMLGFFTDMVPPNLSTKLLDTRYVFLWDILSSSSSSCEPPSTAAVVEEEKDPLLTREKWQMAHQELRQLGSVSAKEIISNPDVTSRLQTWIQQTLPTNASCQLSEDEKSIPAIDKLSQEAVGKVIAKTLKTQKADQLGVVDYASLSAGASVIRVGKRATSPSLIDSLPLWNRLLLLAGLRFYGYGPEAALTPTFPANGLGQCWAFDHDGDDGNNQGQGGRYATLSVELARPIFVSSIVVEHVPKELTNQVGTAIRDFRILGFEDSASASEEPWHLGSFQYDIDAPRALQEFQVANHVDGGRIPKLRSITLAIDSNWGFNYSCLYRFRVQGDDEPSDRVVEAPLVEDDNDLDAVNSMDDDYEPEMNYEDIDDNVDEEEEEEEEGTGENYGAADDYSDDDEAERHEQEENIRRDADEYYEQDVKPANGLDNVDVEQGTVDGDEIPQTDVDEQVEDLNVGAEDDDEDDIDDVHSWDAHASIEEEEEEEEDGSDDYSRDDYDDGSGDGDIYNDE